MKWLPDAGRSGVRKKRSESSGEVEGASGVRTLGGVGQVGEGRGGSERSGIGDGGMSRDIRWLGLGVGEFS
jgi:hypothetical protein